MQQMIKALIEKGLPGSNVFVAGEACNARVVVVSPQFEGKSLPQQHRLVYAALGDRIVKGEIHALSIKSFTPGQWEALPDKDNVIK